VIITLGAALATGALKLTVSREAMSDSTANKMILRFVNDTRYALIGEFSLNSSYRPRADNRVAATMFLVTMG
jgi:hypothetical protein